MKNANKPTMYTSSRSSFILLLVALIATIATTAPFTKKHHHVAVALSPRRTSLVQPRRSLNIRRQGEDPVSSLSSKEQEQQQQLPLNMGRQHTAETSSSSSSSPHTTEEEPPCTLPKPTTSTTTRQEDTEASSSSTTTTTTTTVPTKPRNKKSIVATFALTALTLTAVSAKTGLLPASVLEDGTFVPYTDAMLLQDIGMTLLTGTLGYLLVQTITTFTNIGPSSSQQQQPDVDNNMTFLLEPRDSRKLIHTLSAPLFMVFWPAFSSASIGARVFAAIVPLINAVRLYVSATASDDDDGSGNNINLAKAVSRSGDRLEAAGGPLIYVLVMATCILVFWRESPAGVVALSAMAAGDGVADLVGRRLGASNPWPESITGQDNRKSIAGTLAFLVASVTTAAVLLWWFNTAGCLTTDLPSSGEGGIEVVIAQLVLICGVAAVFELIPVANDNYSVPLAAALLSLFLLG